MRNTKVQSLPALTAKAQKVFNAYIRRRDADLKCISCGIGKPEHAGHYIAVGGHSVHRFNEQNVNGQCLFCNYYKSGNQINYRINLVKKIGLEQVELLEGTMRNPKKWTRLELEYIIDHYKSK